jgi:hypothetical protein
MAEKSVPEGKATSEPAEIDVYNKSKDSDTVPVISPPLHPWMLMHPANTTASQGEDFPHDIEKSIGNCPDIF